MKRRLLNLLAILSLLLFAAAAVMWVRSYWRNDFFGRYPYDPDRRQYRQDAVHSQSGRFGLQLLRFSNASDALDAQMRSRPAGLDGRWRRYAGGNIGVGDARPWERVGPCLRTWHGELLSGFILTMPYWLLVATTLPLPLATAAAGARNRRNRRRRKAGLCPSCGYDLRATAGRCPECGYNRTG